MTERGGNDGRDRADVPGSGGSLDGTEATGAEPPVRPCADAVDRLEALVDGTLEEREATAVRRHLASCAGCRREEARHVDLSARVAALPRGIEPARDLWPAIEARLDAGATATHEARGARAPRGTFAWFAAAAAVMLTAAIVWSISDRDTRFGAPTSPLAVSEDPAAGAMLATYREAEDAFLATKRAVLAEIEARRADLDPETLRIVLDNLEVMERASLEIREALERDPSNPSLRRMLVASYRRQSDLLRSFEPPTFGESTATGASSRGTTP